jgi:hypothetical protein
MLVPGSPSFERKLFCFSLARSFLRLHLAFIHLNRHFYSFCFHLEALYIIS